MGVSSATWSFNKARTNCATLLIVLAIFVPWASANLVYTYQGVEESVPVSQLWYEGNWTEIQSFSAPMTKDATGDLTGKVLILRAGPPYERALRKFQPKNPLGIVLVRTGTWLPGWAMLYVDGTDRRDITVPAMEIVLPKNLHLDKITEGTIGHFGLTPNLHKKAAEGKFQLFMNMILSFWEMAIMVIGSYRIYQFWHADSAFIAIAPVCCALEVLAATLRFVYTIVDPFWTYRMIPGPVSNVLVTISWPVSEVAGILLTFFWAETLARVQIRAVPFISFYKWPALVVVAILICLEIIADVLRVVVPLLKFSPAQLSMIIYTITAGALIACYVSCAIAIAMRIAKGKAGKRKSMVWTMSLRIAVSSLGYLIFIASIISFIFFQQAVYGRNVVLSCAFVGLNLAGIMQVLALKPMNLHKTGSSKTGSGKRSDSGLTNSGHTDHSVDHTASTSV